MLQQLCQSPGQKLYFKNFSLEKLFSIFAEAMEKPFQTREYIFKSPELIDSELLLYRYLLGN